MGVMGFKLGLSDGIWTVRNGGFYCGDWKVQTCDGD